MSDIFCDSLDEEEDNLSIDSLETTVTVSTSTTNQNEDAIDTISFYGNEEKITPVIDEIFKLNKIKKKKPALAINNAYTVRKKNCSKKNEEPVDKPENISKDVKKKIRKKMINKTNDPLVDHATVKSKGKSYLQLYLKKIGVPELINAPPASDTARSIYGDSPRDLNDNVICGQSDHEEQWDTSSFYFDLIEQEEIKKQKNETNTMLNIDDSNNQTNRHSEPGEETNRTADSLSNFTSISEQCLRLSTLSKRKKYKTYRKPLPDVPKLGSLGPDIESMKEKNQRWQKQRVYGICASISNRAKIMLKKVDDNSKNTNKNILVMHQPEDIEPANTVNIQNCNKTSNDTLSSSDMICPDNNVFKSNQALFEIFNNNLEQSTVSQTNIETDTNNKNLDQQYITQTLSNVLKITNVNHNDIRKLDEQIERRMRINLNRKKEKRSQSVPRKSLDRSAKIVKENSGSNRMVVNEKCLESTSSIQELQMRHLKEMLAVENIRKNIFES